MRQFTVILALSIVLAVPTAAQKKLYIKDMKFATKEIAKLAKELIKQKRIKWKKISRSFVKEAAKSKSPSQHARLLVRLLAQLRDGHATLSPGKNAPQNVDPFPEFKDYTGAAMLLLRTKDQIFVKSAWSGARNAGLVPGMEIVSVNGEKPLDWLSGRIAIHRQYKSFSTAQHAEFYALGRGLVAKKGERWKLVVRDEKGRKKKKTLIFERARQVPNGPPFLPEGTKPITRKRDVSYGFTPSGFGYIHIRRCKSTVVSEVDKALAAVGQPKGLILDFRGNTGGSFDHEALIGRFIPKGKTMSFGRPHRSSGLVNYGGPIVVIVDGSVASAGETASGMFKEDGRAYMIGEGPTAGMSSQKREFELPSGFFKLRVSIYSNMMRFNQGRGIEGIGVPPLENLQYQPKDLFAGVDTLRRRAEELLDKFPQELVPYDPKKFGWKSK